VDLIGFSKRPSDTKVLGVVAVLLLVIAFFDYRIGGEIEIGIFYLAPVAIAARYLDRTSGIVVAIVSAGTWVAARVLTGSGDADLLLLAWDGFVRAVYLVVVAVLVADLQIALQRGRALSRVDALTGASNATAFWERGRLEVARSRRHGQPLTIAYMEVEGLDAFTSSKEKDQADEILRTIAETIGGNVRQSDLFARMGPDVFALLLPLTGRVAAAAVLLRLSEHMVEVVRKEKWPVEPRVGAVTFYDSPDSVEELKRVADDVMRAAKRRGEGEVEHQVVGGPMPA
jgi:diguanylate cyclase (GGDEF)-like protein